MVYARKRFTIFLLYMSLAFATTSAARYYIKTAIEYEDAL